MATRNEKRAEQMFDSELVRLGQEVRWASSMLQHAQEKMKQHADNHDSYVAYKAAILDVTGRRA